MGAPARSYTFCPHCAARLEPVARGGRTRQGCRACDFVHFENPVPGVAVVAFVEEKVVLVQSAQPGYLHGQWCFPCGHMEYEEDVREAALRELLEETGLEAKLREVYHVDSNHFEPYGRNSVGIWFLGEVTGGTLSPGGDVLDARAFPLSALPEKICYKSDMRVLYRLCRERGYPKPHLT